MKGHEALALDAPSMPPVEVRLVDPVNNRDDNRVPTKLDDFGRVDIVATLEVVRSTIDPTYGFPLKTTDHHIQWPESWYPFISDPDAPVNPFRFRDIAPNIVMMSRQLENWLHVVTLPPPIPDEEVMTHSVDAWCVGLQLYEAASEVIWWEKRRRNRRQRVEKDPSFLPPEFKGQDIIGEAILAEILHTHHEGFQKHLDAFEKVPEDYWLVDPNKPLHVIARELGQIVKPGCRILTRTAEPRQPLVAA